MQFFISLLVMFTVLLVHLDIDIDLDLVLGAVLHQPVRGVDSDADAQRH